MERTPSRRIHIGKPLRVAVSSSPSPSHNRHTAQRNTVAPHRDIHSFNLERDHQFSWTRCIVSLFSYALLLSDVLRTGLGIHGVSSSHGFRTLEPDTPLLLKQAAYSVQHLTRSNATTSSSMSYWLYKYDTTSVTMRAFAEHLQLPAWSGCTLYKETCDESKGLALQSVFTMIDSLVEAVSTHQSPPTRQQAAHPARVARQQRSLTLRTESIFKDRLYHYAFPLFFRRTAKRTSQAIHYPYDSGEAPQSTLLCTSSSQPQPYSCKESWTQWKDAHVNVSFSVSASIRKRLAVLAILYANHSIDSVILDGADDFTRGSITFQGRKNLDIVVLTRIRMCSTSNGANCTTVAVDDYRCETAVSVMNADSWYGIVATLRVVGQSYTWLRVLLLVVICTHARQKQRTTRSLLQETITTIRTLFLIPSQVVIYGSTFPIALYTLAHLIDSPAIYELVSTRFASTLGIFRWNASDFIRNCAVSMRTVWILSLACHLLVVTSTRCAWSPMHGIPGVPELLISFVASLTIFAQFRSLSLRDTRLLQIHEVVPSRRTQQLRSHTHDGTHTMLNNLFFGSTVDFRCLITAVLALCGFACLMWITHHLKKKVFPYQLTLYSQTLVPYSAGALWPKNRLVVSWFGSLLEKATMKPEPVILATTHKPGIQLFVFPRLGHANVRMPREMRRSQENILTMRNTEASRQAQRALQSLDKRSREVDSAIYLLNLAVMTDPISFARLRFFSGCQVAVYESTFTQQLFVLPHGLISSVADIPVDWDELRLLAVVNTKDLDWCDLLRCG